LDIHCNRGLGNLIIGVWNLFVGHCYLDIHCNRVLGNLVIGVWNLFVIWSLLFGYSLEPGFRKFFYLIIRRIEALRTSLILSAVHLLIIGFFFVNL